jgi:hypothetical protein
VDVSLVVEHYRMREILAILSKSKICCNPNYVVKGTSRPHQVKDN